MIFDPAVAELLLFSHLFSDEAWLVETMIAFSCVVLALEAKSRPNWILLNVAAILLGLSTLTRSVFIPLMLGSPPFSPSSRFSSPSQVPSQKSSSLSAC